MRSIAGPLLEDILRYMLIPKVAVSHALCGCYEATNIRDIDLTNALAPNERV